ncbi:MAG: hypothetical protein FWE33_04735 [Defluviitaleaceae bacterium]|nr:hypothetical protein [Defluviitaleaceae bacterium]
MSSENSGVDAILMSTLADLGIAGGRLKFDGEADTYFTFQIISGDERAFADDDGNAYEHFYRVDLFSRKNYNTLLGNMKKALKNAGFYGISVNAEIWEKDTGYYHVSLDVYYMEDVKE